MRSPELLRTTAFRWAAGVAAWFTAMSLLLFGFIFWQTAVHERARVSAELAHESALVAEVPSEAAVRLEMWLREDRHDVRFAGLFDRDGSRLAGNLPAVPAGLASGRMERSVVEGRDEDPDRGREVILALGRALPDGRFLVVGNDTDQIEHMQAIIIRALGLGLLPVVVLSLVAGTVLARRAQLRVGRVRHAMQRVMAGHLGERLPVRGGADEFDRLADGVNAMLAEMERLVADLRGVGDSIAHDLRTPLTRVRMKLERSRDAARTREEFQGAIDGSIAGIDQALRIVTAVLRIGEIEHGRRRAVFARVDLGCVLREVAELYEPIAEEKRVRLELRIEPALPVFGDRELMVEAVGNLVDNAIKFTPEGSRVLLALKGSPSTSTVQVVDAGPGIPAEERGHVMERFYRVEKSRHFEGSGLGLSLVAAVAAMHGFGTRIEDARPGCAFALLCPVAGARA